MAIALDTSVGISVDYAKTATASITVGSGTGRIVIVEVEGAQSEIASVTVGGQPAAFYAAYDNSSGSPVSAWYLLNPASGAQTVTVTYVSATAESSGVVTSWSGVDQTTPFVSSAGISGPYLATPSNVTLASALSGGQVALSFIATKPYSGDTFVAGGTLIASKMNGGSAAGAVLAAAQYYTAGGTTQTTWTWATSAAQKQASHLALVLNPASAGGTGATVNLTAAPSTETPTSSAGAATVTPTTAGTVNLIAANSTETPTSGTGAATVTPATAGTATITSDVFKGFGGLALAGLTIPNVMLIKLDRTVALSLANQVTNASGQLVITSSALVSGTDYMLVTFNADGTVRGCKKVTAV